VVFKWGVVPHYHSTKNYWEKRIGGKKMKKLSFAGLWLLCLAVVVFYSSPTFASDQVKLYLEGELGSSFIKIDSGGFNTEGPHENTGDDKTIKAVPGLRFGAVFFNFMRADVSFNYRGKLDFTTNSYQPPVPTYFYKTEVSDVYSLMFSVFAEPFHFKNFTPYLGAGVGNTWMKVKINDTIVMTDSSETKFTWQIEAGLHYAFTNNFGLRVGYRYIDMGKFDVPLTLMGAGTPAGNYTGSLTAHEVMAAFRYTF
jgi:opacity protein-like surface antigen